MRGLLRSKSRAENANRYLAASVERMLGEPAKLQETPERAAALATYNQRVTRALTVLAVQLPETGEPASISLATMAERIGGLLEKLAQAIEQGWADRV